MAFGDRNDFRSPPRDRWGLPGTQFPTPNIEDFIVVEDVPLANWNGVPLVRGTPHPKKPEAKLVSETKAKGNNNEAVWRRIYATPRAAQDAYNASTKFVEEASAYPLLVRQYILERPVTPEARNAPLSSLVGLTLATGGFGYTSHPAISFSGGGGSGATAEVSIDDNGQITAIWLTDGGTGYTSAPTVTIAAGTNGFTPGPSTTGDLLSIDGGITHYYYSLSGAPGTGWRRAGGGGTDQSAFVIPAGASVIVTRRAAGNFVWVGDSGVAKVTHGTATVTSPFAGDVTLAAANLYPFVAATATALIQEQTAVLTHEEMSPAEGDLSSLFDRVLRVYTTQPGPVTHDRVSNIKGFLEDTTTQAVTPGTLPGPAVGTTLRDEVKQISTTEAVRTTVKLVDATGTVASGFPVQTTSDKDKETGVTIFTDHFTAGPDYALPATYVGGTLALIAANYPDWKWPRTAGAIGGVTISNGGAGYTSAPTVTISGGGGSGAAAVATLTAGVVTGIGFTSLGTGYASAPSVSFSGGGGSGAAAVVTVASDSVGYSTVSYSPKRYVIDARSSPVGTDSDNLLINIEYARIPTSMIEDKPRAFTFPAVFGFNQTPYSVPNDYGGNYRPPWPIGLDQIGGYELIDHRSNSWPARWFVTYSLGRRESLPPEYSVTSPGTASKFFAGKIRQNTIHPPIRLTETLTDGSEQQIEDIPSSTPASYDPYSILVALAYEERWAGEIYRQTVILVSETRPLSAFPDVLTEGYYRSFKAFKATPAVLLDGKPNGRKVYAKTVASGGGTGSETVSLLVIGKAAMGDPPVSTINTISVNPTGTASASTFVSVREALVLDGATSEQGATVSDSVQLWEAVDPDTASLTVTGAPSDKYLLKIGTTGNARVYQFRTALTADGISLTLTNGGLHYRVAPTVTISGDGSGATAIAVLTGTSVTGLLLTNPGSGYTAATVTFQDFGTGAAASLAAGVDTGTIPTTTQGSGYDGSETVSLTGGGGSGATVALGTISGGALQSIVVMAAGTGYTSAPTVVISGGAGSGAAATVSLHILSATVTNGGSGYNVTYPPDVIFDSANGGATGTAVVTAGAVTSITLSGFTPGYATVPNVSLIAGNSAAATAAAGKANQILISSTPRTMAARIAGAIMGQGLGSYTGVGTLPHAELSSARAAGDLTTVNFASSDPLTNTSSWDFAIYQSNGSTPAAWATLTAFTAGSEGQLLCTIPAGTPYAYGSADFSTNLCLVDAADDNDRKAVASVPAATVFYTDWLEIPDGKEITLVYGCLTNTRVAYQKQSVTTEPSTVATSIGCTHNSTTISYVSGATPSSYAGCKILIAGDTCENELVNGTTLLRAYQGTTATRAAAITPLVATTIANAAPGKVRSVSIGIPGSRYIRLKLTQNAGTLRYRAMHARASWTVTPDD